MGFQQGLSGLNAAAKNLDVIGNNVANASTVGFKASRAEFGDVYAAALSGAGVNNVGIGVGLGLQGVVKEFVSGIFLIFARMISVGDYVELEGGSVRGTGLTAGCCPAPSGTLNDWVYMVCS